MEKITKKCIKCQTNLTELNWHTAKQKKNHNICTPCSKMYYAQFYRNNFKIIREKSTSRYLTLKKENKFEYGTEKWSIRTLAGIRSRDKKKNRSICDFTAKEYLLFITNPCIYCKDKSSKICMDRIDNSLGHIKTNVVPACHECNEARMDNFTFEEMKLLGETIRLIKEIRRGS